MVPLSSVVARHVLPTLAAGTLVLAACGPAGQPAAPTTAPAAQPTTAPAVAPTTAPAGAPTTAAAPAAPKPTVAPTAGAAAAGQPKQGGRIILGEFADAKTLNPVLVTDVPSDVVNNRMFVGMLQSDAKTGEAKPQLAEKFEFSQDGKTLTFTMRDGLRWSDGSPMTGDDFKFTVMATMRSKKTNAKSNLQEITGAKEFGDGAAEDISGIKVDGRDITVSLNNAFCPALTGIGNMQIIPKSVYGKYIDPKDASKNLDDAPENTAPPVAGGPFKFKEWVPNDHVTLVRNDNFWQKANIDEWVHKVYPNQDALTAALKVGEVDMAEFEPKDLQDLSTVNTLQVFKYLNLGYTFIGWNQMRGGKEFFQSKPVRQALTYGLNIDLVVERVLFGEGVKMISNTPPVSWAFDTSGMNEYKYDPAKSEQLLQGDGWTKGSDGIYAKGDQKLEFSIITNSGNKTRETLIQVAAEQYKQIGMNVEPKTESFEALVDRIQTSKDAKYGEQGGHDFDAYVIGWSLTADPDMYSIWHSSQTHPSENNNIIYKNPDLDKALEDSRTKCGQADRKDAFKRANQILNEEQPYNFGFAANVLLGVNKKVKGIEPGPFARRGQALPQTWWVE
jgi:peptide/nickel transport system substrate-binding protein